MVPLYNDVKVRQTTFDQFAEKLAHSNQFAPNIMIQVYGVLDIDSLVLNGFDEDDKIGLEALARNVIEEVFKRCSWDICRIWVGAVRYWQEF